jgi:hypothetical protein
MVHEDMGRLEVLVDEPMLVDLAQGGGDADREAQTAAHLHGRAEQAVEGFAARVLQQQQTSALVLGEGERPHGPAWLELRL